MNRISELWDFDNQILCKECGRILLTQSEQDLAMCADCIMDADKDLPAIMADRVRDAAK
jgi:hypothetical protein